MKKIFLSIGLAVITFGLQAQIIDTYISGSLTTPGGALGANTTTNMFLLTTNRAQVHTIQLLSAASGSALFYDSDNTNAPFYGFEYTNAPYVSFTVYPTNYVTSNYSTLTLTTNFFTNAGVFTLASTNIANTNVLNPAYGIAWTANVAQNITGLNLVFSRGITMRTTTNINYIIGYTP